jgi:hypothetical protein
MDLAPSVDRYFLDQQYYSRQRLVWERKLGRMWVAVYGGRLVAKGRDSRSVVRDLEKKKIPPQWTVIAKLGAPRSLS